MTRRSSSKPITIGSVVVVLMLLCFSFIFNTFFSDLEATPSPGGEISTTGSTTTQVVSNPSPGNIPGWLKVYFTDPNPPDQIDNGIDRFVVPIINSAENTIDVASFDLNLPSIVDALAEAAKRGVTVRVVIDGENGNQILKASDSPTGKDYNATKILKAAKVKIVDGGRSNGLMHNKMMIIDGRILFMGSWNYSYNDTFRNNNNLLQITSPEIISNYQAKFDEMFEQKVFGAKAEVGALRPELMVDGIQVENYFSPVDGVMSKLVDYVSGAKKSIHFMIFTYTHKDLSAAMIERARAGVNVQGLIENRGASQGAFPALFCAGLPVKEDGNKYTMHHKVIIIDGKIVITGSFNFTVSADDANDDNILVIHDPATAALYEQEYQKMYNQAVTPDQAEVTCP